MYILNIFVIIDILCIRLRGWNDVLVPVTPYLAGIFQQLRKHKKLPPRVQAVYMQHIRLLFAAPISSGRTIRGCSERTQQELPPEISV